MYKGQVVFGKQSMPYFDRIPKDYQKDEACFVFVNQGQTSIRSQNDYMDLDHKHGVLAKCLNYFFETNSEQKKSSEFLEVIAVIIHPKMVEELFEFDLSTSNQKILFNKSNKLNTRAEYLFSSKYVQGVGQVTRT